MRPSRDQDADEILEARAAGVPPPAGSPLRLEVALIPGA